VLGLGTTEIILILVVLAFAIGPKNIPGTIRAFLKGWYSIKSQVTAIQRQAEQTKEELVGDLKKDIGIDEIEKEIKAEVDFAKGHAKAMNTVATEITQTLDLDKNGVTKVDPKTPVVLAMKEAKKHRMRSDAIRSTKEHHKKIKKNTEKVNSLNKEIKKASKHVEKVHS